jgi:hypothetical protein
MKKQDIKYFLVGFENLRRVMIMEVFENVKKIFPEMIPENCAMKILECL